MESDELSAFNNAQQLSFKFDLAKIKAAHFLTEPLPTTMMQYDLTQKCTMRICVNGGMIIWSLIPE